MTIRTNTTKRSTILAWSADTNRWHYVLRFDNSQTVCGVTTNTDDGKSAPHRMVCTECHNWYQERNV